MKSRQRILIGSLVVLVVASALAFAGDPPGRVARVQYVSGSVSVQPTGTGDWAEAVINRPLTSTDNVWADKDARAELNVGTALAHIDSETSLTLTDVSDNSVKLQLHQGTLNLHVRKINDGETFEVYAPDLVFNAQRPGDYKFTVNAEGDAVTVAVWKGEGDVTAQGQNIHLREGQSANFGGGTHTLSAAPSPDSFDEWCRTRSEREEHSESARYVSPEVIGSADLDNNGRWETAPTYGSVWVPRVAAGWAPYRDGHWVWIDPWGWTWVDDQPWGFAPSHYGRWVYYNDYWAWAPGAYWGRPYYAPALVGWFGGGNWGVGLGFGGGGLYGWCPLGWGEPFYPWYGVSRGYFGHVNYRIHNYNVYEHNYFRGNGHWGGSYANSRWMTATNGRTITGGLRVNQHVVNVSPHQLASSPMGGGRHDLAPTAASRLGGNLAGPSARPSSAIGAQSGFARGSSGSFPRNGGPAPMRAATPGNFNQGGMAPRNVPRPQGAMNGSVAAPRGGSATPQSAYNGSTMNGMTKNGSNVSGGMRNSTPTYTPRNVPRPTGQVMGAPAYAAAHPSSSYSAPSRSYSAPSSLSTPRGNYSSPRTSGSYSGGSPYSGGRPSYSGGSSYSAPRNYGSSGGSSYSSPRAASPYSGGSYSAPRAQNSYGGGSYSAPRSSGSYGGGSYSAPRSSGSYSGGGGSYSAPRSSGSYGGGGHSGGSSSARPSGGGGHASGGRR
jgi:hypothetical protein